MTGKKILIVDDDAQIASVVTRFLKTHDFQCSTAPTAERAIQMTTLEFFDIILLDINLPDRDGISLIRDIKQNVDTPIIFISGRTDVVDTIIGLEMGGDDFVKKPFELRELLARITTVLRRTSVAVQSETTNDECYQIENILIDLNRSEAFSIETLTPCDLTSTEFGILKTLALSKLEAVSRELLLKQIFGSASYTSDRTVDSHVVRLRKKLTTVGARPDLVKTVYRVGYRVTANAVPVACVDSAQADASSLA